MAAKEPSQGNTLPTNDILFLTILRLKARFHESKVKGKNEFRRATFASPMLLLITTLDHFRLSSNSVALRQKLRTPCVDLMIPAGSLHGDSRADQVGIYQQVPRVVGDTGHKWPLAADRN